MSAPEYLRASWPSLPSLPLSAYPQVMDLLLLLLAILLLCLHSTAPSGLTCKPPGLHPRALSSLYCNTAPDATCFCISTPLAFLPTFTVDPRWQLHRESTEPTKQRRAQAHPLSPLPLPMTWCLLQYYTYYTEGVQCLFPNRPVNHSWLGLKMSC